MLCWFCEDGESVKVKENNCDASVFLVFAKGCWREIFISTSYDVRSTMALPVDYCPMCGRKLSNTT